jgi:hypothetical protein
MMVSESPHPRAASRKVAAKPLKTLSSFQTRIGISVALKLKAAARI